MEKSFAWFGQKFNCQKLIILLKLLRLSEKPNHIADESEKAADIKSHNRENT